MVTPWSQCGACAHRHVLVVENVKQDWSCWPPALAMALLCHCTMLMWHDLLTQSYILMRLESVVPRWFPGHGTIVGLEGDNHSS